MRFYKGLYWLLGLNILIKPIWIFGIDRVVQNRVGYEAYGTYFSILGLSIALSFLADAGLTNMINRELSAGGQIQLKELFKIKLLYSLVYVLVVSLTALLTRDVQWDIVIPVVIIQLLTSYLLFFRAVITAHQHFKTDAWLSVLDKTLMVLLCGWALYVAVYNVSIVLFLWLQVISLGIGCGIALYLFLNIHDGNRGEILRWKNLAKQSMPFLILLLLMSAHNRLDAFLLHSLHPFGAHESGVYASAYRLLDAGNVVGYLVASFLVPYASRNMHDHKLISTVSIALRQGLLLIAFIAVAAVFVYASWIQKWLYPSLAAYDENVLKVCIATLPAYYLTHIYGSLLTAKGALKTFILIVLASLLVNVLLNLILIPKGAIGTCTAALISQSVCAMGCMIAARKKASVDLRSWLIAGSFLMGLSYGALFYVGAEYQWPFLFVTALGAGLTALLMFVGWQRIKKAHLQL
jgi:O-antigen/teichoic acid export membrane protein